ncbi:MAG: DUF190 domain-containing protein [Actinomycetota bacterium]|jgi:hypothetical protein|nr:DUF190 domain-containing protein [Actinomycetota bacterium]
MTSTNRAIVNGGFRSSRGCRLTVWIEVQDHARHGSLMVELLKRVRVAKMAGVTVFEGISGFGASGAVHRTHLLRDDAPLAVVVVDRPERVDAFVGSIGELLGDALLVLDDVTIVDVRSS